MYYLSNTQPSFILNLIGHLLILLRLCLTLYVSTLMGSLTQLNKSSSSPPSRQNHVLCHSLPEMVVFGIALSEYSAHLFPAFIVWLLSQFLRFTKYTRHPSSPRKMIPTANMPECDMAQSFNRVHPRLSWVTWLWLRF